jgi:DNA replication and repair protein RecF
LTVVHGAVGAGKTNLLEGLYVGCVGRSCKRAPDRELVHFGERAAHVRVDVAGGEGRRTFEVGFEVGREKVVRVDGTPRDAADLARSRSLVSVFMPDHLELLKGPASLRRAHFDDLVSALWPGRYATRTAYGRCLAQRNALLARVRAGQAAPASLGSWEHELSRHGFDLMLHREEAVASLARPFTEMAKRLGLAGASLEYRPRSAAGTAAELASELEHHRRGDIERGFTTHGPHRDDVRFALGGREGRRFASQGQQRLSLLSLLLAERRVLAERAGEVPLLLLDDVLSELDPRSRVELVAVVKEAGQALLTTADLEAARPAVDGATLVAVPNGAPG